MTAPGITRVSAAITMAGAILSAPVSLAFIAATHPQPEWRDADTFVRAFHWVQTLPYFAGLLLVGGFVALIGSLFALDATPMRARSATALALTGAFAAMIFVNYAIQTTVVPAIASRFSPADGPLLGALTMSNPRSLGWALEMWGYGVLGVATWLIAPVLRARLNGQLAAMAFVANGVVSVTGAVLTAASPGWVMTTPGMALFAVWNLLVLAMAFLTLRAVP